MTTLKEIREEFRQPRKIDLKPKHSISESNDPKDPCVITCPSGLIVRVRPMTIRDEYHLEKISYNTEPAIRSVEQWLRSRRSAGSWPIQEYVSGLDGFGVHGFRGHLYRHQGGMMSDPERLLGVCCPTLWTRNVKKTLKPMKVICQNCGHVLTELSDEEENDLQEKVTRETGIPIGGNVCDGCTEDN